MAYNDLFRLSSHAVITNNRGQILLLKANYGERAWGLPGGALDQGETVHNALHRECFEELSCDILVRYLSGIYFHQAYNSQAFIFRCGLINEGPIALSEEHSEFRYADIDELSPVQHRRVSECLNYSGQVLSAKF